MCICLYLWHMASSPSVARRAGIRWQRSTNPRSTCLEKILEIRWGCSGWWLGSEREINYSKRE